MCGIVGVVSASLSKEERKEILLRMGTHIQKRGPDGFEIAHFDHSSLGFGRLAIQALENGRQPIFHGRTKTISVANGEIYNNKLFRKLYSDAEWRTESDCETIHTIYDMGSFAEDLSSISGMFASAIYSGTEKILTLSRDKSGQKPLFYFISSSGDTLLFSSSIRSIVASGIAEFEIKRSELPFLFFSEYPRPGSTCIRGLKSVKPGSTVTWQIGNQTVEERRYWTLDLSRTESERCPTYGPIKDFVDHSLVLSVREELTADVPVGILLSGGIDSSLIACIASEITGRECEAFSMSFESKTLDETDSSAFLCKTLGIRHNIFCFDDLNIVDAVIEALSELDSPLGDSSYIPTYWLSKFVSASHRCVLGGDGGDELYGGYPTYKAHKILYDYESFMPQLLRGFVLKHIANILPYGEENIYLKMKLSRFLSGRLMPVAERHMTWMSTTANVTPLIRLLGLSGTEVPRELFYGPVNEISFQSNCKHPQNIAQLIDFMHYLPGSIHSKSDQASMAHGVEIRSPFVNQLMIDAATRIVPDYRISYLQSKRVLRSLLRDKVPGSLHKQSKRGFNFDVNRYLPVLTEHIRESVSKVSEYIDCTIFNSMLEQHKSGIADHRKLLWNIYSFSAWASNIKDSGFATQERISIPITYENDYSDLK